MIGSLPVSALAPLDYRYALDAALAVLLGRTGFLIRCNVPELLPEIRQRIPQSADLLAARGALWVEPLIPTWQEELAALVDTLRPGALLVIVASRPLARLIPERSRWTGHPLGLTLAGLPRLGRALDGRAFKVEAAYGIHTLPAIVLSMLGQQWERRGRPDRGDRLHFAARRRYHTSGFGAALATVGMIVARKEGPG